MIHPVSVAIRYWSDNRPFSNSESLLCAWLTSGTTKTECKPWFLLKEPTETNRKSKNDNSHSTIWISFLMTFCLWCRLFVWSGLSFLLLLSLTIVGQALTPSTYITPADRARFRQIFMTSASEDLESLYYSVLGVNLLQEAPSEPQVRWTNFSYFRCH